MEMTIRSRLTLLSALMLSALLVLGLISYSVGSKGTRGLREMLVANQLLTNHQTADMMHDALRGDVLLALAAQSAEDWRAVDEGLREHSETFLDQLDRNSKLPLD